MAIVSTKGDRLSNFVLPCSLMCDYLTAGAMSSLVFVIVNKHISIWVALHVPPMIIQPWNTPQCSSCLLHFGTVTEFSNPPNMTVLMNIYFPIYWSMSITSIMLNGLLPTAKYSSGRLFRRLKIISMSFGHMCLAASTRNPASS